MTLEVIAIAAMPFATNVAFASTSNDTDWKELVVGSGIESASAIVGSLIYRTRPVIGAVIGLTFAMIVGSIIANRDLKPKKGIGFS